MNRVDVNKDLILQSIRDDEDATSKELIFFNAWTHVPITSWKSQVEVANSGKTIMFFESIRAFPKISENSRFRSFKLPIIRKDSCGPWHFEWSRFDCSYTVCFGDIYIKKALEMTSKKKALKMTSWLVIFKAFFVPPTLILKKIS